MNPVLLGLLGSGAAGAMTAVGAAPALFGRTLSVRAQDALLGFAAGVMLAASFFSLILPGIEHAEEQHGSRVLAALVAAAGVALGAGFVALLNATVPHEHFVQGQQGPEAKSIRRIWLFVLAITIHNLPEGLAVGVGFADGEIASGASLAIGIGLQNAPEGLAVAAALRSIGYSPVRAFLIAALTGLAEPIAGTAGAFAASLSEVLLPWALTFAAGAMLYVISHEIIPETHRNGHENGATLGLVIGLVTMLVLDVSLG